MTPSNRLPVFTLTDGQRQVPLIDVRNTPAVTRKHILGSINIDAVKGRRMELPPRGVHYAVLYDAETHASAAYLKEYFPEDAVALCNADDAAFWSGVPEHLIATGKAYPQLVQPRLWQPSRLVADAASLTISWLGRSAHPGFVRILDAGSGMGRNAVFIAEQLNARADLEKCVVDAVDNRAVMATLAGELAQRNGVGHHVVTVHSDVAAHLERCGEIRYDIMLCARFMDKKLLSSNALTAALHPSLPSLLLVEHFHVTTSHPTSPEQVIREGEILALVSEGAGTAAADDWESLRECLVSAEDGRPLLQVVLRYNPRHADVAATSGTGSGVQE